MKDLRWAKKTISELRNNKELDRTETNLNIEVGKLQRWAWNNCIDRVLEILNQLDEPEVLSQEWIDEHTYHEDEYDFYYADPDELKNLLVPKQELPVIPKFVADFIESYDGDFYSLLYDADNISSDASLVTEEYYELGNWLSVNSDELLQAVANGYEVEEEQKYYVLDTEDIPMLFKSYGAVKRANSHLSIHEKARNTEHYQLTEQEIKDYDERYWPFAVKVEELEE